MDCSICLNEVTESTGRTVLSCGHHFHISCFLRNILAAATTCPNCRNPLSEHERLPEPTLHIDTSAVAAFDEVPIVLPNGVTRSMLESLYVWPLSDYIYNRVEKTGVHHQAAYSTVFTSLLTAQAAIRGGLVRSRLRRASNSA